ncbi:MAG: hypothetical protein DWQ01_12875 [Planctomycetota bacterium]|nr:MAG: hypothetical protein DWQ01_12875 [Planctomycetota bacterium]
MTSPLRTLESRLLSLAASLVSLWVALGSTMPAQGSVGLNQTVMLPVSAAGDADHAVVAVNSNGDLAVVWQNKSEISGTSVRRIEALCLSYLGAGRWSLPTTAEVVTLADPTLGLMGGAADDCWKPDLEAVGDHFVATWPRAVAGDDSLAQMEAVLLQATSSAPVVLAPASGVGFVFDPQLVPGSASVMPDLARMGGFSQVADQTGVVYVHQSWQQGSLHEFELRFAFLNFQGAGFQFEGPFVLDSDIPVDDFHSGGPYGARVIPDLVEWQDGSLVTAYGRYAQAAHFGNPQGEGAIVVQAFDFQSGGVPQMGSRLSLVGSQSLLWQRRPNLATSSVDGEDTVSMVWFEYPDGGIQFGDADVHYRILDLQNGLQITDLAFPNQNGSRDAFPVPVHGSGLRACLVYSSSLQGPTIRGWTPAFGTQLETLVTAGTDPQRPAVDLLEFGPPGQAGGRLLPILYEATDSASGNTRIFLKILRL